MFGGPWRYMAVVGSVWMRLSIDCREGKRRSAESKAAAEATKAAEKAVGTTCLFKKSSVYFKK